jgi:hypothetical protein
MRRILLLLVATACSPGREPTARDATAVREVSCLVMTVSIADVPGVADAVAARTGLDNRCARAAAIDLHALVARGQDGSTREARLNRRDRPQGDRFDLAASTRTERTLRFDAPAGVKGLTGVCLDLGPAVVDDVAVPAACFLKLEGRWEPEP